MRAPADGGGAERYGGWQPHRRFVARSTDGERTVLLSAPLPGADPARFAAEAEAARHLLGPWIAPVSGLAGPATGHYLLLSERNRGSVSAVGRLVAVPVVGP
jgi:hypothetical protein